MNEQEYTQRTTYRTGRRHLSKNRVWHCAYHVLLQRPIAVSVWTHTVNTLCQHEPHLVPKYSINKATTLRPSYIGENFSSMKPWESHWDNSLEKFVKTPDMAVVSTEHRFYARIVAEKAAALDKINYNINQLRKYIDTDLIDQRWIYEIKQQQAKLVLEQEYPELEDPRWDQIYQYAILQNYDIKTAAQAVLIQSNEYRAQMLKTEEIRHKYTQFVLSCNEMYEILGVMEDFYRDAFIYY